MLKQTLQEDLNKSLKTGDQLRRLVLGMVMTAIKNREVEKRTRLSRSTSQVDQLEKESRLTEEEILEVIASEVKKRKESVEQFKAGGRDELAQKEKSEIDILLSYLPEQMSEDQIRIEIQKTIAELGALPSTPIGRGGLDPKDTGRVIGAVMAKLKGKADGGMVSRLVKESLANF